MLGEHDQWERPKCQRLGERRVTFLCQIKTLSHLRDLRYPLPREVRTKLLPAVATRMGMAITTRIGVLTEAYTPWMSGRTSIEP